MIRPWALLSAIVCTIVVFGTHRLLSVPTGLHAAYFAAPDWRGAPRSYVDNPPSTALLRERRSELPRGAFSVEWRGFLAVPFGGTYTFRAVSQDSSSVYVRGLEVVANAGTHGVADARGSIPLDAGVHAIFIRYADASPDCSFELWWSRDGRGFEPVPAWALVPARVPYARVMSARVADGALALLAVAWYAVIAGLILKLIVRGSALVFGFRREGLGVALGGVLLLSVVLDVWGIWWSMPNIRGWAPDEVVPPDVLAALQQAFSHGWNEKYPPFHYMVLAAADSPIVLLSWLGLVDVHATAPHVALVLIGRFVSVALAVATIVLVYRCGLELYGHRGGLFAALTTAVTVPFAYYSKLANLDVPYLFWFTVSLLAYIRILQRHERRDYLLFAASAALAGCTKDQIWGAYFLTPAAILFARWRQSRQAGGPIGHVLFDPTILEATAVGVLTFVVADNLLFNFSGFTAHVRLLLGTPAAFQKFPRTAAGQLQMAWHAVVEMRYMFGWPLAIIVAVALMAAIGRNSTRPSLHWLLVPALSYYVAFVGVILFYFDRYFFPVTLVLAIYAGWWLDRFLAPGVRARTVRMAAVSAAFLYSAFYVATVNYAMTVDSRYAMSRWLHGHARPEDVIASLGPLEYHAIADGFRWESVESAEDVARIQPAYVILNGDQMPYLPQRVQSMHESLRGGRAGYELAATFRSSMPPLPGLHPDLGMAVRHGPEFSDLAMINPTMEVFVRRDLAR